MALRIGVVGLGFAGAQLHLPALQRLRGVELVGTADPDPTRAATVPSFDALLERRIDAVVIASPVETHFALAMKAFDAGCHVYVEKPMTDSIDTAEALTAAVPARRTVQLGFAYRFHPLWQRVFALADAGHLRGPWRAQGQFRCPPGDGWHHPVIEVGCHHVDLLTRVHGESPTHIDARDHDVHATWSDGSELHGRYGPDATGDTMRVTFGGNRTVTVQRQNGIRLRGAGWRAALPDPALLRARQRRTGWERSFERALAAFVAAALEARPAIPGPTDGLRSVKVSAAALDSLVTGTVVAVPQ